MQNILRAVLAGAIVASASPALATVIVDEHPYSNPDPQDQIHNIVNQTGNTVTGRLQPFGLRYDFNATPVESLTSNGNGHAKIEASDGGMFALTMTPRVLGSSFTAIDFNVNVPNGDVARTVLLNGPIAEWVSFSLLLGNDTVVDTGAYALGGNNMFLVFGDDGEIFKSITWRGWTSADMTTTAQFQDVRQIDLNAVPEPSTWAMMILGFGLIGGALRSRKSKARTALSHG